MNSPAPPAPVIVWLRRDLRLADNPALSFAAESGRPLVLVHILDDEAPGKWRAGGASRWWRHESIAAFERQLAKQKGRLVLRRGRAGDVLADLVAQSGATALFWNRAYEPYAIARDSAVKQRFSAVGVAAKSFPGNLLLEPWTIQTGAGTPFRVFTPFLRACLAQMRSAPLPAPGKLVFYGGDLRRDALEAWRLQPTKPDWAGGLRAAWTPGETGARAALDGFLDGRLAGYAEGRDTMAAARTSLLSPHLHWGEISPAMVFAALDARLAACEGASGDAEKFRAELIWREFAHHLLFHWPLIPERNWRAAFDAFPWRDDKPALRAWSKGETGYPIVDAAMRELWSTGFMHNRARMIAASFLIKHLLIDWRAGADWFWDTLVDADLANNSAGWQWVAGSGADAAPYFRIFNPVTQGQKHDPTGAYVRRWLPELARLPDGFVHKPWEAPPLVLADANIMLGKTYPAPMVEHGSARARALEAYGRIKR
jgi:deoxyribodipyrimidine photo-lyase